MRKSKPLQSQTPGITNLQNFQTLQNLKEVLELLVQENKEQKIIIEYLEKKLDRTNPVRGD